MIGTVEYPDGRKYEITKLELRGASVRFSFDIQGPCEPFSMRPYLIRCPDGTIYAMTSEDPEPYWTTRLRAGEVAEHSYSINLNMTGSVVGSRRV